MKKTNFKKTMPLLVGILLLMQVSPPLVSKECILLCNEKQFFVPTSDGSSITLTRYEGEKDPVIFIHGMGCNHWIFDVDKSHSLARYLNSKGWDVWLLDLRTHDGDGDFKYAVGSDREYIKREWDFDNTLLKIDVVNAVDFVKNQTGYEKLFLSGHSYGGYLAYAYAMLIGEQNLSGIITTGASPYANPPEYQERNRQTMYDFGYEYGNYAYVKDDAENAQYISSPRISLLIYTIFWTLFDHSDTFLFYKETTPYSIQKKCLFHFDGESAGVCVDMYFGKDSERYNGSWVDPQTLYNYSANLDKITVPILFIAGDEDSQDPSDGIYSAYENVSSNEKQFYSFANYSHMDLLMGDDADTFIFPKIDVFMSSHQV